MSLLPPASVMASARQRHHQALAGTHAGTVRIGEVDYEAAVKMDGALVENGDGGQTRVQMLVARIAKSLLVDEPTPRTTITHDSRTWIVQEVAGREGWSQEWILRATGA